MTEAQMPDVELYRPLNTPKPFGEDVWIVDGPEIRMDYGPISLPFPTRMTVVRLSGGELWVHSPIAPDPDLFDAIEALGTVAHLVAPNSLHYWFMADWIERYPEATTCAVPDLVEKAKRAFRIDVPLGSSAAPAWQDEIDWIVVPGTSVTEAVFHVHAAQVTILVDLIENFDPQRIRKRLYRWAVQLVGADGHTPFDLRMTFWPKRKAVAAAMRKVLDWPTERIVLAHGGLFARDGQDVLRQRLRWAI